MEMRGEVKNYIKSLKLHPGRISIPERLHILNKIGEEAQALYNYYLFQGMHEESYNLDLIKDSLQFGPDPYNFENAYYLQGKNRQLTLIAIYFEYGTGLNNATRYPGLNMANGYIYPATATYLRFMSKKYNKWITKDKVKGVRPIAAMTKALKTIDNTKDLLQRLIRYEYSQEE